MQFSVNADYVGQICHTEGVSGFGVILGHQTIAGGGPPRHRFEVWFPHTELPFCLYDYEVENIAGPATAEQRELAEKQQAAYRERYARSGG